MVGHVFRLAPCAAGPPICDGAAAVVLVGDRVARGLDADGRLPISTMGGLRSRGHPVGATGMYQVVEAVQQLRGTADASQVRNATLAMTQNLGGMGATAITHVLAAE